MPHNKNIPQPYRLRLWHWAVRGGSAVLVIITVVVRITYVVIKMSLMQFLSISAEFHEVSTRTLLRFRDEENLSWLPREPRPSPTPPTSAEKDDDGAMPNSFLADIGREPPVRPKSLYNKTPATLEKHAKKSKRFQTRSTRLRLDLLPLDVLQVIVDELSRATDTMCLALARKNMQGIVDDFVVLARRVNAEDGPGSMQCRLERDRGDMLVCMGGTRLPHIHDCAWWDPAGLAYDERILRHIRFRLSIQPDFYLSWCTARLVLLYELSDLMHGYHVSVLNTDFGTRVIHGIVLYQEMWTAKIVSAARELMLKCMRTWTHVKVGDLESLRGYLWATAIWVCYHEALQLTRRELHGIGAEDGFWMGGCKKCWTDWMVTSRHLPPDSWIFAITTYHNVGACRSPHDKKWHAMGGANGLPRTFESGRMKDMWDYEEKMKKRWGCRYGMAV